MSNRLLEFRLAYLRAISTSWNDDKYKNHLLKSQDIQVELKEFGFRGWDKIKIKLIDDKDEPTRWNQMESGGWVGANDIYHIKLPLKPHEKNQETIALAAYYQLFPTFFGNSETTQSQCATNNSNLLSSESASGVGLVADSDDFVEFGAVTLRAIALAWENSDFRNELFNPPITIEEPLTFNHLRLYKDATPVLSKYFGFNNPWNFNIIFEQSNEYVWEGDKWDESKIPKNAIRLHYPRKPHNFEQSLWPIALTSYNSTGPAYPFTCG